MLLDKSILNVQLTGCHVTIIDNMADWSRRQNGRTEEMLDHENEQRVEGLSNKVSRLKNIAFDIQTETEDHNRYLDGMNTDFDSSEGLLSGSVHRITNMVKAGKGNRKMMCYMILGLVTFFFLVYYLISKVTAG